MAYDHYALFDRVRAGLASDPHTSLSTISRRLGVERHTIERGVQRVARKTFRQLRAEGLAAKALNLFTLDPPRSIKEVSFLLGYKSACAFSRFIRRAFGATPTHVRLFKPSEPPGGNVDCRRVV